MRYAPAAVALTARCASALSTAREREPRRTYARNREQSKRFRNRDGSRASWRTLVYRSWYARESDEPNQPRLPALMVRGRLVALMTAIAWLTSTSPNAIAAVAHRRLCSPPRGSEIVARDTQALVWRTFREIEPKQQVIETSNPPPEGTTGIQSSYLACVRGSRRPVHLFSTGVGTSLPRTHGGNFHLSAELFTLTFTRPTAVMQINVATGRRVFQETYEHASLEQLRPEHLGSETNLALDAAGDVAWVLETECGRFPCPLSVVVHDQHGTSTIASYEQPTYVFSETGPPPSEVWNLTLADGHVSWSYGPTETSQHYEVPLP